MHPPTVAHQCILLSQLVQRIVSVTTLAILAFDTCGEASWDKLWSVGIYLQAQLIEANADAVDEAMDAVRAALAQGLSWAELERLITDETAAGNRVAALVAELHLDRNAVTLVLPDWIAAADRAADRDGDADVGDDDEDADSVPTALVVPDWLALHHVKAPSEGTCPLLLRLWHAKDVSHALRSVLPGSL